MIAETRTDRTMNVSSRTPKATAKPISAKPTSGQGAERGEGAGEDQARRGDDAAGGGEAGEHALPGAGVRRVSSRIRVIRKML